MKHTHGIIKTGVLAIAGGAAIGLASFGMSSSPALARDNRPDIVKNCIYDGKLYLAGEKVTIDDGFDVRTFLCSGLTGQWVEITYLDSANKTVNRSR
jgi:hypothetical protein